MEVGESFVPLPMASLLNLQSVGAAQRAAVWERSTSGFFPGTSIRQLHETPAEGRIGSISFGNGRIWSILSPPAVVCYDPAASRDDRNFFSLMVQLSGTTAAQQQHRSCLLRAGEFCAIDNSEAFELEVPATSSNLVIVQMPRLAVLGRHPYLERHTAKVFDPDEAGTELVRGLLMSVLERGPVLADHQRAGALAALIELLAMFTPTREETPVSWRTRTALRCISECFADTRLTAVGVAKQQGMSRRGLDKLMIQDTGSTLTAQIWHRRLAQAASDLTEPRLLGRSVAQIAFGAGFANPAHFSRAFRRSFNCTPGEWRQRHLPIA